MFDSHAHVMFPTLEGQRPQIIQRAYEGGLSGWLEVGVDLEQSQRAVALVEQQAGVYAAVGVHPDDIGSLSEDMWRALEKLSSHPKVKAIGEVGLDFYRQGKREEQLPVLQRFIALAQTKKLPIVFHVRDGRNNAHDELLQLLAGYPDADRPRGVIHTFSGTLEQAKRYVELGLYVSFSGVITFKNAAGLQEVAAWVPAEKMLIETDCPFLAPEPYRGQQNEPAYVKFVAQKLADIRGVAVEEIERQTDTNAKALFAL
jgi:TatD DNase family protein